MDKNDKLLLFVSIIVSISVVIAILDKPLILSLLVLIIYWSIIVIKFKSENHSSTFRGLSYLVSFIWLSLFILLVIIASKFDIGFLKKIITYSIL